MTDLKASSLRALKLMDLTTLNDDDTDEKVIALCHQAKTPVGNTAAICIYPRFIPIARKTLKEQGTPEIRIATVTNFPHGNDDIEIALAETRAAIAYGADEVDVVFPYRALMAGNEQVGFDLVKACKEACAAANVLLKVIIETGELKDEALIRKASEISIKAGADFIKTSTGKVAVNATPESARIMMEVIRDMGVEKTVGFKPAGGVRTTALLTDMNQVLASSAGNAVEVREAVQFLTGEYRNPRLFDVTMALCVEMLISGKLAKDDAEARAKLQAVLDNGKAAEVFGRMVAAQKGPTDFVENYAKYLPTAMLTKAVYADTEGFVSEMDTRALGMAVVAMGGGRRQASDTIDYSVGFTDMARLGDQVDGQRPLAVIHAKDENSWQEAAKAVKAAIKLADKAPESTPTVYRRISE